LATEASAASNAATVIVKQSGPRGEDGTDGTDGAGFNNVRKVLIDTPTVYMYKKNNIATVLDSTITIDRGGPAYFKDIHGTAVLETADFPREESDGWLVEPAGTNLVLESETFDTTWVQSNLTVSADAVASPNGSVTADQLIEDGAATVKDISQAVTVVNSTAHALTVFAKPNGRDWIYLQDTANSSDGAYFDVTNGVIGTVDGGIVAKIDRWIDGYYKCSIESTSTSTSGGMKIQLADADAGGSYSGDSSSGVYLWGAQIEANPFATSYIVTTGSSAARFLESHSFKTLNNIPFLDNGFSIVLKLVYSEVTDTQDLIVIPDAAGGDLFKISTNTNKWAATVKGSDSVDYEALTVLDADSASPQTIIATLSGGVLNLFVDGVLSATDTIATGLTGAVDTSTGAGIVTIADGTDFVATISDLRIYDFALNSTEITYLS